MKEAWNFAVLRGDRRQNILCDLLREDGYPVRLLPEPEKWGQENLPPPGAILIAAKAGEPLRRAARDAGFRLLEYGSLPSFQRENGQITAENALQVAMKHRLRTLYGSDALVIGWGNIGKPLAALLLGLGARTAVAVWDGIQIQWLLDRDSVDMAGELRRYLQSLVTVPL